MTVVNASFQVEKNVFSFQEVSTFWNKTISSSLFLLRKVTYFLVVRFCIVDKCCVNEDNFQFRGRVKTYKRRKKETFIWHLGPPIAISIVSKNKYNGYCDINEQIQKM